MRRTRRWPSPRPLSWPANQAGPRYAAVREAAALVERALDDAKTSAGPVADGAEEGSEADRVLARAWARDTDLLLAELSQRRGGAATEVWLPGRLAVSSLVAMAADPARLAQQIRRPMPRPPAPQAQRGTAFHLWLEQRFGQQRLIDPEDLLGAADDSPTTPMRPTSLCSGSGSRKGSGGTAGRLTWKCRSRRSSGADRARADRRSVRRSARRRL